MRELLGYHTQVVMFNTEHFGGRDEYGYNNSDDVWFRGQSYSTVASSVNNYTKPRDSEYSRQMSRKDKEEEKKAWEERAKIYQLGLSGLKNMGATCYLASAVQMISNSPVLSAIIRSEKMLRDITSCTYRKMMEKLEKEGTIKNFTQGEFEDKLENEVKGTMSYQLRKILRSMWGDSEERWGRNVVVRPRRLKEIIGTEHVSLSGFGQQDSHEALQFILNHLHEDSCNKVEEVEFPVSVVESVNEKMEQIKECGDVIENNPDLDAKTKASDILMQMYEHDPTGYLRTMAVKDWKLLLEQDGHSDLSRLTWGLYCTKRECTRCGFMSPKFDMFNMIQLAIPEGTEKMTLDDCFKHHFTSEKIEYKCSRCGHTEATKEELIYKYPNLLIIHFKRFETKIVQKREWNNKTFKFETSYESLSNKRTTLIDFPINDLKFEEDDWQNGGQTERVYDLCSVTQHIGNINGGHYYNLGRNRVSGDWFEFNDADVLHIPEEDSQDKIVNNNAYLLMYRCRSLVGEDEDEDPDSLL